MLFRSLQAAGRHGAGTRGASSEVGQRGNKGGGTEERGKTRFVNSQAVFTLQTFRSGLNSVLVFIEVLEPRQHCQMCFVY